MSEERSAAEAEAEQPQPSSSEEEEEEVAGSREGEDAADSAPPPPSAPSLSPPSPSVVISAQLSPTLRVCCREVDVRRQAAAAERDALRQALVDANAQLDVKERELTKRLSEMNRSYVSTLSEMRGLLSTQQEVGTRWRTEMDDLTARFEARLKELTAENKALRCEAQALETRLKAKENDLDEARELSGIYSAKLTKLQRKFKKLKDEDDASYMEITF